MKKKKSKVDPDKFNKLLKEIYKEEKPPVGRVVYMYGWVCPKCGSVNAPFSTRCECVQIFNQPIVTCANSGNTTYVY